MPYSVVHIDALDRARLDEAGWWRPVRRSLGLTAFGANAYTANAVHEPTPRGGGLAPRGRVERRCEEEAVGPAPLTQRVGAPSQRAPRTKCVRDAYFGTRPISSGPVDARRTPAAPSSSMRSAAASPVPILRLRVRAVTGVRVRRCTRAGATISLASIARRRILSSRATTDASTRSPLESGLPSSGTAIRFVDGDVS